MFCLRRFVCCFLTIKICFFQQEGVCSNILTTLYDPFKEELPSKSRGIYKVNSNERIKFIGKSATDINQRVLRDINEGAIEQGDMVEAIIFRDEITHSQMLVYQKDLIQKYSKELEKHKHQRATKRSEQISDLQVSFEQEALFLQPKTQEKFLDILRARYDPFKEKLPSKSRGVYQIVDRGIIRYTGSSGDINKRIGDHIRRGALKQGDMVEATIFPEETTQPDVLAYEKILIQRFGPKSEFNKHTANKHTGTPGRPWHTEQLPQLRAFFEHNASLLRPNAIEMIRNLLKNSKSGPYNRKMTNSLFRVMKLFK